MEKQKSKKIVVRKDTSPMGYASQFLKDGGDLANLEKMMELQERHDKNQAKKAYSSAMADFKKDPPRITKSKTVNYETSKGVTQYNHAELADVASIINTSLSKHGLSASWKTDQGQGGISVVCTISHVLGHCESTTLSSPPDNSGGKNSIQAIGSTVTYLQRYTLLALAGLAAHDQDDDGKGSSEAETILNIREEIEKLNTVPEVQQFYKANIESNKGLKKEFISLCAARKASIVKESTDADN